MEEVFVHPFSWKGDTNLMYLLTLNFVEDNPGELDGVTAAFSNSFSFNWTDSSFSRISSSRKLQLVLSFTLTLLDF